MNIIGTIKTKNTEETYFVGWEEHEKTVYLSSKLSGPWIEVGRDIIYECNAINYAQNYIDSKIQQHNILSIL